MNKEEKLKGIPQKCFVKIPESPAVLLSSRQKAALMRKGNQLFNEGDIKAAGKIFITIAYRDGLIRVGDFFYSKGDFIEALHMYEAAHAQQKKDILTEKIAVVLRNWLET